MLSSRPAGRPPAGHSALSPLVTLALAAGLVLGCGDPPPPRVVLVTAPALPSGGRAALLGERAGSAVAFESFYAAAPWTAPSLASMLTGRHPWEHGVLRPGDPLPADAPTVAGALSAPFSADYASAAAVARKSELGPGFTREFDLAVRTDDPIAGMLDLLDRLAAEDRETRGRAGQLLWIHRDDEAGDLDRLLDRLDSDAGRFETHVVIVAARGGPVRAPLLLLSPRVGPGARQDVAGSVDVARTLLSLAGIRYPPAPWSNGRDLAAWAPDPELDAGAGSGVRAAAFGMLPPRGGRPVFYAVDRGGGFYSGGASGLGAAPDGARRDALEEVSALFRALDARIGPDLAAPPPTSRSGSPPPPSRPAPPPGPGAAPAPP